MNKKRFGIPKFFVFAISLSAFIVLYAIPIGFMGNDSHTIKNPGTEQTEKIRRVKEKRHHILANGYSLVWDPSSIEIVMSPGLHYWELTGVDEPFVMFHFFPLSIRS